MALFWFLLALALLAAALVLLRLDARQRGGSAPRARSARRDADPAPGAGGRAGDSPVGDPAVEPTVRATGYDDDDLPLPPSAEVTARMPAVQEDPDAPRLAPFQRSAGSGSVAGGDRGPGGPAGESEVDPAAESGELVVARDEPGDERAEPGDERAEPGAVSEDPTATSSPRLLDKVRAFLPARRQGARRPAPAAPVVADPLAGSPVVRWLEDREFAPTPTPAPEFLHGDFAGGLSALGTVSHGMFRGRRAIMGVTGGRTVLALRRDTASDVVLDLSRPDVDAEPGFHDAGEMAALEARTSDIGRLDLIDRERLADAVRDVPADVRRIWAEGEWVAATIDGVDDPSTWDDVVVALHHAADVLAPFPPIGGRARALPAEIDPGSPGAADGPEADPTTGMDGESGTGIGTGGSGGTGGSRAADLGVDFGVDPESLDPAAASAGSSAVGPGADVDVVPLADTDTDPGTGTDADPGAEDAADSATDALADTDSADAAVTRGPRRTGHLRLVPDRPGVRDLSDVPVVADRGDGTGDQEGSESGPGGSPAETTASSSATSGALSGETSASDSTGAHDGPTHEGLADEGPADELVEPEPDPFAEVMEPAGPVPSRGDVAADFLPPRPPLSRPTRGVGQAFPDDASVPPLAANVTGGAGIKPLGSEDDDDEIRTEVERFDAARIDGGSDLDTGSGGRHAQPAHDEVPVWLRPDVTPAPPRPGAGKHRRPEDEPAEPAEPAEPVREPTTEPEPGSERPGVEPDVEQTTRIPIVPPDDRAE